MKFAKTLMTAAVAAGLSAPLIAVPAVADEAPKSVQASATCTGKPKKTIFRKYYRGPVMVPLRCGDKKWGYKHLVARGHWTGGLDSKISRTVWSGTITTDLPGQRIYERLQVQCPPRILFRVVTNPGPYGRDPRINPQGIISAYKPGSARSAAAAC
ncbi:hypothetical protein [Streptomyces sp. NPDC059063]|uniref:hypothetical protein n=1 Tax=unclassified Streptomyces TaxID=2593676 RepID=UPI00369170BD